MGNAGTPLSFSQAGYALERTNVSASVELVKPANTPPTSLATLLEPPKPKYPNLSALQDRGLSPKVVRVARARSSAEERARRELEEFKRYRRTVIDLVSSSTYPLHRDVFVKYWANSVTNLLPKVYCYCNEDEGLYAFAFPITRDGDLVIQLFVVKVVPELSAAKFRAIAWEVENKILPEVVERMGLPGKLGGVTVYVVAPHYERFARLIPIRAFPRRGIYFCPIIERDPERVALRVLRWWTSYLGSRLEGFVAELSRSFNMPGWAYVRNQLERMFKDYEEALGLGHDRDRIDEVGVAWGGASPTTVGTVVNGSARSAAPPEPPKKIKSAVLHYMSAICNRVSSLGARGCRLAEALKCLYETVERLVREVFALFERLREKALAKRLARAIMPHVEREARRSPQEVARIVDRVMTVARSTIMEWAKDVFLKVSASTVEGFFAKYLQARPV